MAKQKAQNRYIAIIETIFLSHFDNAMDYLQPNTAVVFERQEIESVAEQLGIKLPKNIGDVLYSFRHRQELPISISEKAPNGYEWIIESAGRASYKFSLWKISKILPNSNLATIKIPDATPQIIAKYSLSDEQALLAKLRYNRLIDIFLGITAFSLQNHLRTTVSGIGQIEIDELYIGVNKHGAHFIIPVQAKGGSDSLGIVQTMQDYEFCKDKHQELIPRLISAQFIDAEKVAMFELQVNTIERSIEIIDEKHYALVKGNDITVDDLRGYGFR